MNGKQKVVRCRVCGRIWESKSPKPRCTNRRCRSTRVHELAKKEIIEMISKLEDCIETPADKEDIGCVIDDDEDFIKIIDDDEDFIKIIDDDEDFIKVIE